MIIIDLLENSLFAGIAAIGFGSISNIPLKSFPRLCFVGCHSTYFSPRTDAVMWLEHYHG